MTLRRQRRAGHARDAGNGSSAIGATHPTNFTYRHDVEDGQKRDDIRLALTIDRECDGRQRDGAWCLQCSCLPQHV